MVDVGGGERAGAAGGGVEVGAPWVGVEEVGPGDLPSAGVVDPAEVSSGAVSGSVLCSASCGGVGWAGLEVGAGPLGAGPGHGGDGRAGGVVGVGCGGGGFGGLGVVNFGCDCRWSTGGAGLALTGGVRSPASPRAGRGATPEPGPPETTWSDGGEGGSVAFGLVGASSVTERRGLSRGLTGGVRFPVGEPAGRTGVAATVGSLCGLGLGLTGGGTVALRATGQEVDR